ncbi:hypothetical protein AXZ77_2496 [Thioclava sp. ES.031]|uniref:hypothetical protein n=1 Tax=unclassified Thioclava TaxID=2621713 RepID=UPI000BF80850|nr:MULTISPECIES: hypothetical protein [unclassified Thioclava]MPQ95310.1 hypothetical protein [Thioclava sp. JE_KL1]PFG63874.1 hypothetical protein AXZ77_2496 [Thioclava sp. ES.031]
MTKKDARENPDGKANSGSAEASQLRETIDRGGTGDKVAFSDPAAAPLGTDDEAAGTSPSLQQVRMAQEHEGRHGVAENRKPGPAEINGGMSRWALLAIAFVVLFVSAVAWVAIS